MRRLSKKRQAELDVRPEIPTISEDRTPVRPIDESYREFVRRLPCVVCLRPTLGGDPCHRRTKRVSGDWIDVDGELSGNIYPACREHHTLQHQAGVDTFADAHDLDLAATCRAIGRAYQRGWSDEGLAVEAIAARAYTSVDVDAVNAGGLPF